MSDEQDGAEVNQIERSWAIVDGDQIAYKDESKVKVLEWAWSHDIVPHRYELIALPKNGTPGVI